MNEPRGFEGTGITGEMLDRHITGNYGENAERRGLEEYEEYCEECNGTGKVEDDEPCAICDGTGIVSNEPDWDNMPGGYDYEWDMRNS